MRSIASIAISLKRLVATGMSERLRISASINSSLALLTAKSNWVPLVLARIHLLLPYSDIAKRHYARADRGLGYGV
jgi:hypothetical protein